MNSNHGFLKIKSIYIFCQAIRYSYFVWNCDRFTKKQYLGICTNCLLASHDRSHCAFDNH